MFFTAECVNVRVCAEWLWKVQVCVCVRVGLCVCGGAVSDHCKRPCGLCVRLPGNPRQLSRVRVYIRVLDVNDNAPTFATVYETFVCENAKPAQVKSIRDMGEKQAQARLLKQLTIGWPVQTSSTLNMVCPAKAKFEPAGSWSLHQGSHTLPLPVGAIWLCCWTKSSPKVVNVQSIELCFRLDSRLEPLKLQFWQTGDYTQAWVKYCT